MDHIITDNLTTFLIATGDAFAEVWNVSIHATTAHRLGKRLKDQHLFDFELLAYLSTDVFYIQGLQPFVVNGLFGERLEGIA
jgi:hypothetical protein